MVSKSVKKEDGAFNMDLQMEIFVKSHSGISLNYSRGIYMLK